MDCYCTEWTVGNVCLVCECAAFELRSELEKWTVSSTDERLVGEDKKPSIKFSIRLPDWTCIVCKKDIVPPVFQCHNGHLACIFCSEKRVHCTACPGSINRIKNVALGQIIKSAKVSCKYAKLGCNEMSIFVSRDAHEKTCSFSPTNCTMPGCTQTGYKHLFEEHLKSKHKYDQILDLDVCTSAVEQYCLKANVYLADSSNSAVLLRHKNGNDSYLLHQQSTELGEILHITSLENSRKRKYAIDVEVSEEQTYCYKSTCTSSQQHGGLLVPKQHGAPVMKMLCKIRLN